MFDFAEMVLLRHPLRQPGHLHFVTSLKFDFFGVSVSNRLRCDIFCLPEGHWPSEKTADEVASMINYSIDSEKYELNTPVIALLLSLIHI